MTTIDAKTSGTKDVSKYPEHQKMKAVQDRSQVIGEFLEWLLHTKRVHTERFRHDALEMESRVVLAVYYPRLDDDPVLREWQHRGIEAVLADYFEIDLHEINREKQQMYEQLRKNTRPQEHRIGGESD